MSGNVTPYTNLITSEHQSAPNFMAMVAAVCQTWADGVAAALGIPQTLDLDTAVGQQLDMIGQWIGASRFLSVPLTSVYFAFDTAGVGFDQGVWYQTFNPASGIVELPDDHYRILLKAKIINNQWNGSISEVNVLMNNVLAPLGYGMFIKDYADLTIDIGIYGTLPPSALIKAMLTSGILDVRPAGVHVRDYIAQQSAGPMFAFDISNSVFAGFDQSSWATVTTN